MNKLPVNLFDLTPEQADASKMMYNNRIVKCLIAPAHSYNDLEKLVHYDKSTFLFPEREMNDLQKRQFISMILASPRFNEEDEIKIITSCQEIILDMIDTSVRILNADLEVLKCPIKTFMANIHDVHISILKNEKYQVSTSVASSKSIHHEGIDAIFERIQYLAETKTKTITRKEYDQLKLKINMIGEELVVNVLENHLSRLTIED